jgi:hypothetical protein
MYAILSPLEKWLRLPDDGPVESRHVTSKSCVTKFENNFGCLNDQKYRAYRKNYA